MGGFFVFCDLVVFVLYLGMIVSEGVGCWEFFFGVEFEFGLMGFRELG